DAQPTPPSPLPLHDALPIFDPSTMRGGDHLADPEFEKEAWLSMVMLEWGSCGQLALRSRSRRPGRPTGDGVDRMDRDAENDTHEDRKSTRLNSSHVKISYAV